MITVKWSSRGCCRQRRVPKKLSQKWRARGIQRKRESVCANVLSSRKGKISRLEMAHGAKTKFNGLASHSHARALKQCTQSRFTLAWPLRLYPELTSTSSLSASGTGILNALGLLHQYCTVLYRTEKVPPCTLLRRLHSAADPQPITTTTIIILSTEELRTYNVVRIESKGPVAHISGQFVQIDFRCHQSTSTSPTKVFSTTSRHLGHCFVASQP